MIHLQIILIIAAATCAMADSTGFALFFCVVFLFTTS